MSLPKWYVTDVHDVSANVGDDCNCRCKLCQCHLQLFSPHEELLHNNPPTIWYTEHKMMALILHPVLHGNTQCLNLQSDMYNETKNKSNNYDTHMNWKLLPAGGTDFQLSLNSRQVGMLRPVHAELGC